MFNTFPVFQSMLWLVLVSMRIWDPDPDFYRNADRDPDTLQGDKPRRIHANPDRDPDHET
jgi:hypothetical protein